MHEQGIIERQQGLAVFRQAIDHSQNPHVQLLAGDFLKTRELAPSHKIPEQIPCYELLGMKELFINFAVTKEESHPTSKALQELTTGDYLTIGLDKNSLQLLNHTGVPVARLAKSAQTRWQDRTAAIMEIRVIALAGRYKTDIKDQKLQEKCRNDSWEVPVVELHYLREE
jgi:ATP-dependent DNA helicase RecQ